MSKKKYCDLCEKFYPSIDSHIKTHGTKRYECNICKKTFKSNYGLKDHINKGHVEVEKSFKCDICSRNFVTKRILQSHQLSHSVIDSKWTCDICEKSFRDKSKLWRHLMLVHDNQGSEINVHKCDICERGFQDSEQLKSHMFTFIKALSKVLNTSILGKRL